MIWWELRRKLSKHKWPLIEWGGFFLFACLLTYPVLFRPTSAALGSVDADGMKHLWTLWWIRASVWDYGDFPFGTDLINYPEGMDLYPIEPLNGLLACFMPWANLVSVSNFLAIFNITLTGAIGSWFGRTLSGSRWGGLVCGAILAGSSVMAFFVHVGVGELNHLWWLPLGLGCLVKARRTLKWEWFVALGLCLVLAMISCFYLGFFLAVATLTWSVSTIWASRDTPKLLLCYLATAFLSASVVIPVSSSFSSSYKSGDVPRVGLMNYVTKNYGQPITDPPSARLELKQLLKPSASSKNLQDNAPQGGQKQEKAYVGGRYLGWVPLALAIIGLARRPKDAVPWLVVGGVGIVFACGTYLTADGVEVEAGGSRLLMPIFWLNRVLAYYAEPLNFPVRFMALAAMAVAAMSSLAIRNWKWALLGVLAVLEVMAFQILDWPWQTFQPRQTSILRQIKGVDDMAVIDLPLVVRSDQQNRFNSLSAQMSHGKKTNTVPIERIEYFARDGIYFAKSLKLMEDLAPVYDNMEESASLNADYRGDLALLRDSGFGWVLITYRSSRERLPKKVLIEMKKVFGDPHISGQGLAIWRVPEVEYTEVELDRWRSEHKSAMAETARRLPGMGPQLPTNK